MYKIRVELLTNMNELKMNQNHWKLLLTPDQGRYETLRLNWSLTIKPSSFRAYITKTHQLRAIRSLFNSINRVPTIVREQTRPLSLAPYQCRSYTNVV